MAEKKRVEKARGTSAKSSETGLSKYARRGVCKRGMRTVGSMRRPGVVRESHVVGEVVEPPGHRKRHTLTYRNNNQHMLIKRLNKTTAVIRHSYLGSLPHAFSITFFLYLLGGAEQD